MDHRPAPRLTTWTVLVAATVALSVSGCSTTPWVPPEPDLVVNASGVTTDPAPVGAIDVPAGEARWVEVTFRGLTRTDPTLMVFEVEGGREGQTRIEVRNDRGRLVVASRSSQRYGRTLAASVASADADGAVDVEAFGRPPSIAAVADAWTCLGTCAADRYVAGTYYVRVHNTGSAPQRYDVVAYGRVPGDANEPNDVPSTATAYRVAFAGDGPLGAIEHPGDVDHFRLTCAPTFAGPSQGMRLELVSTFPGALALDADGDTFGVGEPTPPVPCGATVAVRSRDGSAGPAASSRYALLADAVPLYVIDAPAQPNPTTPTALGRLVLAPGETQVARLTFGSSSAGLWFVEIAGAAGTAVDGLVRLDVRDASGGTIGVSTSRHRFAPALDALGSGASAASADIAPAAISVLNGCLGPCVATRYRTGTVLARITNTSSQQRTVDLYAYGAPESDQNEPNDTIASATVVRLGAAAVTVAGAIERMGDADMFRLECGGGFQYDSVYVTLESSFPGSLVVRRAPSGPPTTPGSVLEVPCNATVVVHATDDSAGPSASSRYTLHAE